MPHLPSTSAFKRWLPALAIAAGLFPAFAFTACKKPVPKAATISRDAELPPDRLFTDARTKLDSGKYAEAAEMLRKANAGRGGAASLQDWMLFYGGFAELLNDREAEARPMFATLAERTAPEKEAGQLARFFSNAGASLGADGPVPTKVVSIYDRSSYEVLALYLFALKNESLDAMDDAMTFYRQFATAPANGPEPWNGFNNQLKKFRAHASNLCEYEEYVEAATRARKASADPEVAEEAVLAATEVRARIKQESKLIASLDDRLKGKTKVMAVDEGADAKAFPPAKEKYNEAMAKFEFAEARGAIFEPKLKSVKLRREQEALESRAAYLEKFKFYLILEVGTTGYAKPVTLKSGATVPNGIAKFEDTTVELREASGAKAVPWGDVAPESIYAIAKSLVSPTEEPDKAAFRKWHLGNFAAYIGRMDEARTLLNEAAAANPQYAPEIPLLLGEPAKP